MLASSRSLTRSCRLEANQDSKKSADDCATGLFRAAFFEAFAAAILKAHGFRIAAQKEAGVFGEDFDFKIEAIGASANVEATSLTGKKFRAASVLSALGHKRKQLPKDEPAIIACFMPFHWRLTTWDMQSELRDVAAAFLRGTRRINHLLVIEDVMVTRGKGGFVFAHALHYQNLNPRITAPILDEMLSRDPPEAAKNRAMLNHMPDNRTEAGVLSAWIDWLRAS